MLTKARRRGRSAVAAADPADLVRRAFSDQAPQHRVGQRRFTYAASPFDQNEGRPVWAPEFIQQAVDVPGNTYQPGGGGWLQASLELGKAHQVRVHLHAGQRIRQVIQRLGLQAIHCWL